MIFYLKKVRELFKKFIWVQVRHVPRAKNSRADALEKLATTSQEDLEIFGTSRAPPITLDERRQRRSVLGNVRAELDGPHLGLFGGRNIAKRSKGGLQAQDEVR